MRADNRNLERVKFMSTETATNVVDVNDEEAARRAEQMSNLQKKLGHLQEAELLHKNEAVVSATERVRALTFKRGAGNRVLAQNKKALRTLQAKTFVKEGEVKSQTEYIAELDRQIELAKEKLEKVRQEALAAKA